MKCQKCGYELNNGEVFCPNCGNKATNDNSIINNQTDNNVQSNMMNNSQNEQNPNTTINNNQQEQITIIPTPTKQKKKKNYWWIPIVLFLSFPVTSILSMCCSIIADSANDGARPGGIFDIISGFFHFLSLLGILAFGLTLPSIGLVIFLNHKNQKEPTE